jgi:phosphoglycerate dehydrogenase-like enzyme
VDPDIWRIVSLSPLPAGMVEQFVPDGLTAEVVVVDPRTAEAAAAAVTDADIVIGDFLGELGIDAAMAQTMDRCRLVQHPGTGYNHIDAAALTRRGITVANVAGANAGSVAEYTVMAAVALLRRMTQTDRDVRAGGWPALERPRHELAGKTWGIVGFGRVGQGVARRLVGWDVDVVYSAPRAAPDELGARRVELDALLEVSDVVSLHVPLRDSTRRLLDGGRLALMKANAVLINVARGDVVDEDALYGALAAGQLAGAALDVFSVEPLPAGHRLTKLDNVILTSHDAGAAVEANMRVVTATGANIARVMRGEAPIDVVTT